MASFACNTAAHHTSLSKAVLYCSTLATSYVGSLYVLVPERVRQLDRNDPRQIRWRSFAAAVICLGAAISYPILFCDDNDVDDGYMQQLPRQRHIMEGVLSVLRQEMFSCSMVLLQTSILYMGPILKGLLEVYDDTIRLRKSATLASYARNLYRTFVGPNVSSVWKPKDESERWQLLRNLVIAPLSEEIVFRAYMVPVLSSSTGWSALRVSFTAPLFFGVAHKHHALMKLRQGRALSSVLLETSFQFAYTTLFGAYVSFAYLRTQSLCAVVLCHSFCNTMGLPDLSFLRSSSPLFRRRRALVTCLVAGLVGFVASFSVIDISIGRKEN